MEKNPIDSSIRLPIYGLPDRYRVIDRGSIAVLLVENWNCAVRLAVSCCLEDQENRDLILAGCQAQRQTVLFVREHELEHDFSGVTVRTAHKTFLSHRCPLREVGFSLPYVLEPGHDAIIVCDASEVPLSRSQDLLIRLQALEARARESRHGLLLIFHCTARSEFHLQINTCRSAFSGLAECLFRNEKIVWKTLFWNCLNQYGGEFSCELSNAADGLGFECHTQSLGDVTSVKDNDIVWSASFRVTPDNCKIKNLHTVTDNEKLFHIGLEASSAMLIFGLVKANDIAEVGRFIHELRVRRGRRLRIAVVEGSHPMRSSSMAFLLSCGANIVFDHNATVDYIRLMITSLRGAVYPHAPLDDFEQALEAIVGEHQTGLVPSDKFLTFVEAEVTHHADWLDAHGVLVILTPAPGLSHKECMEHFHPRRSGDFGTYTHQTSLVYLPGCLSGFVELALSRCFELSPADLFSSYRAVYDDIEILALLKQIKTRSLETELSDSGSFVSESDKRKKAQRKTDDRRLLQPNTVRPQPLEYF